MSDKQDLDALARQFLDLWEDQITALASDPKTIETTGRMFTTATPLLSHPLLSVFIRNFIDNAVQKKSEMPLKTKNDENNPTEKSEKDNKDGKVENSSIIESGIDVKNRREKGPKTDGTPIQTDQTPSGSPSSAFTSGGSSNDLAQLRHRIADLERRLARLESNPGKPGRRSENSSRKRRS